MKIETKYNIGDEVYFLYGNKVCKSSIEEIDIHCNTRPAANDFPFCDSADWEKTVEVISVCYEVKALCGMTNTRYDEECLFRSKADLLKSL